MRRAKRGWTSGMTRTHRCAQSTLQIKLHVLTWGAAEREGQNQKGDDKQGYTKIAKSMQFCAIQRTYPCLSKVDCHPRFKN